MSHKILLTTTSYQDTPGRHQELLKSANYDIITARGPLTEQEMLNLIQENDGFDAFLCGDDDITSKVIDATSSKLKVISKYGIGLDKIDVEYATSKNLPVLFTPGVNHTTVAEHAFGLMISLVKAFPKHISAVLEGQWKRQTGYELAGKTMGIFGLGRIGQEVAIRAKAFGMSVATYSAVLDENFCKEHDVQITQSAEELFKISNFVSLHAPLLPETEKIINAETIALMPENTFVINTARGGLVDEAAVAEACKSGQLGGYGTDVLNEEPIKAPHPFLEIDNIIITPHIGSRTYESVERQALRATNNLINFLSGNEDYIQFNK